MNLRGRITLILSLSILAFVALVLLDGRSREDALGERLNENVLRAVEASWIGLSRVEQQRMLRYLEAIRGDSDATAAFVAYDTQRLTRATLPVRTALRTDLRTTGIQALRRDGSLFFDTRETRQTADPILTPGEVRQVMAETEPVVGLVQAGDGELVFAIAAPIFGRAGPTGVLLLYTPAGELVDGLAEILAAPTTLLGPSGTAQTELPADSPLARLAEGPMPFAVDSVVVHHLQGRDLRVATLGVTSAFEEPLGTLVSLRDVSAETRRRALVSGLSYFGLACALMLFLAGVNWYLRRAFRPLNGIIRSLNALSAGRTDFAVDVPTRNDEIGRLAGTFETFRQSIEARERLGKLQQELDVAAQIQRQILPSHFPGDARLGFAARMTAARQVGGDFYDVFALPDGRIGCVIADVSGKGMGAALFMAASRTVIRSVAATTTNAAECIHRANLYLAAENDAMMFVTVFYAIVDPASGEVSYCNAGHNPPARIAAGGEPALLPGAKHPALGVFEEVVFTEERLRLEPGERLFLYTDGITEAMTHDHQEFGEARMLAALADAPGASADQVCDRTLAAVSDFVAGAEQSDDITCLAVAYDGGEAPAG
jgi:sigma-B regulation protein RsbU (phosphoserine phosphatase)